MELPIQLKFFRKLELYQEYKSSEKKASKTWREAWDIEKKTLKWTTNYHHLESPLSREHIKKRILKERDSMYMAELDHAMGNLCVKRFAKSVEGGIEITADGLMMGEVISDIEERLWRKYSYALFIVLVWLTVASGIFTVTVEAINRLSEISQ